MGILLNVYNDMVKEAEMSVVAEQVEILEKYASAATELLQAEFPNDYTKEDVVELADKLIQRDVELNAQNEKVAEAKAITEEYVKVAEQLLEQEHGTDFTKEAVAMLADKMMEADAQIEFEKEAEAIQMQGFLDEFNKLAETDFSNLEELSEALKTAGIGSIASKALSSVKGFVGDVASGFKNMNMANLSGKNMGAAKDLFKETVRSGGSVGDTQAARQLYFEARRNTVNARKALGVAGAGVVGTGALGAMALSGGEEKKAAFTQHGKVEQTSKALAYSDRADAMLDANAKYPGMAVMKGQYVADLWNKLHARKNAYKSEGLANQLKAAIPFFGMGPKGQESLEKLKKNRG